MEDTIQSKNIELKALKEINFNLEKSAKDQTEYEINEFKIQINDLENTNQNLMKELNEIALLNSKKDRQIEELR